MGRSQNPRRYYLTPARRRKQPYLACMGVSTSSYGMRQAAQAFLGLTQLSRLDIRVAGRDLSAQLLPHNLPKVSTSFRDIFNITCLWWAQVRLTTF